MKYDFAIIGAGSWGTALASHLARVGQRTVLVARTNTHAEQMTQTGMNARYLPEMRLPDALHITSQRDEAIASADHVMIVTPSHAFKNTWHDIARVHPHLTHLIWATKGLDHQSGCFLHECVAQDRSPDFPMMLLTGPSFAKELMDQKPTAMTLAHNGCIELAHTIQRAMHGNQVRVYTCEDLLGAELGGAVKNILAIAVGIADGMNLGMNAKAALMTRGMAEMRRLGKAVGAHQETLIGLSGLGDLILTCTDNLSRNRRFGVSLGQGLSQAEAIQAIGGQVVEGIQTTASIHALAEKLHISMPITEQMIHVLFQGLSPKQAVLNLFGREIGHEH